MSYMRNYNLFTLNSLWFLITINFLIFLVTLVGFRTGNDVVSLFGLAPVYFINRPWTIITSLFVHGGLWHIAFNMISLFFVGNIIIKLMGEGNFLKVYFAGGILGNIFYLFLGNPTTFGFGASGAIFALVGVLVVIMPKLPVYIFFIPKAFPLWVAVIVFVLFSFIPGISWQAHIGGLTLGLLAGLWFKKKRRAFYY
jgi:membrane associated rhomboid family serine protease